MSRKWKPPATTRTRGRRQGNDHAASLISPESKSSAGADQLPLIDKYGHRHSEGVLENWSPAAIAALGVKRRTTTMN